MSDVALPTAPFMALYADGRVSRDDIHDFIGAWHDSGDDEPRSLVEFLGMTEEEYDVWLMDPRTLQLMVAARRGDGTLRDLVAVYYDKMRATGDPDDRPCLHVMSYWLTGQPPA